MLEPIGKHIRLVNERNGSARNPPLLGVSIEKVFMPSVANTIGSNMANYKIVRCGQFACSLMQVRRDKKMPVALLRDHEEAIVSPAYPVFKIVDEEQLLPEYLMMWMLRPEFDREACFYAVGGVRGSLEWDDLCSMQLPVPSIEKQREIVTEHQTVVDRIRLNKRLNEKLEEAAQAIYKQWFVDFEFPMTAEYAESIGKPELTGQPYKSSGGEMEYNRVLEQKVPRGWAGSLYMDAMDFRTGKLDSNAAVVDGTYPFFTCSSETLKTDTFSFDTEAVLLAGNNASAIYPLKHYCGKFDAYQRTYVVTSKHKNLSNIQIYFDIQSELDGFKGVSSGTATKFLTKSILGELRTTIAAEGDAIVFARLTKPFFDLRLLVEAELEGLAALKTLLTKRIATGAV